MKIVLVFPPNIYQTKQSMPPLGLAWIAAVLRENGFKDVSIIDSIANRYSNEEVIGLLKEKNPDIIGISFGTQIRFNAFDLARLIKKNFPNVVLVAGGPHPTLTCEDTLKNIPEIDIICRGEGEYSFLNLVKVIDEKRGLAGVRGVSFKDGSGKIIHNAPEPLIENLDTLPFPARDLLQMEKYDQRTSLSKKRCTNIMSSRGCPYFCVFCSVSEQWGHRIRYRSAKNVVDEIEHVLKTYPFLEAVRFFDDVFTMDKARVLEICRLIKERNLNIVWECEARANTMDEQMAQAMREAGCEFIDLGVESGSDRILKNIKKSITVKQVIAAAMAIKKAGIGLKIFIMHSLPGETYEDIKKTVFLSRYLCHKIKADGATQGIAVVYPGTELEKIAKEIGTLSRDFSWSKNYRREKSYPPLSACPYMPIFEQPDLTYEQVFQYVKKAKFAYFLRHPFDFFRTFLKHRRTIRQWLTTKTN
ncbi:MAG: radical SAM protein [Candidatus Nealsonbacteria bacterium]